MRIVPTQFHCLLVGGALACGLAASGPAAALEFAVSAYGGGNFANDSVVDLDTPAIAGDFDIDWSGDSFSLPPYWGVRTTLWLTDTRFEQWGIAFDYAHAKVKADLDDPEVGAAFTRLEFTDGLNLFTLNALYDQPLGDRFSVYGGLGAGASVPHVEVSTIPNQGDTRRYELGGPAVQALVGGDVKLGHGVSVFGEYKANYSWNDVELDGGGSLQTDVLTHQFAAGLTFRFGGDKP